MTVNEEVSAERRVRRLSHYLRTLVPIDSSEPLSERTCRLLWMSGLHLGTMSHILRHDTWVRRLGERLRWLDYVSRFADLSPTEIRQRVVAGLSRLPQGAAEGLDGSAGWWATHVIVCGGVGHEAFDSVAWGDDARVTVVGADPQALLRATRILRPHLVLLNADALGERLPTLISGMRDDQRLTGSAIWVYGCRLDRVPAPAWTLVDGRVALPASPGALWGIAKGLETTRRLRELTVIDPTTGVFSFAYLRMLLASEVARSARKHDVFTVIALTWNPRLWMDGTWDSPMETQVRLQQLATYLQMVVRRSDVVTFDGAGRFYVVAFDASTTALCRRFQEASEQLYIWMAPLGQHPYPPLLTGVARYPEDGRMPEDLLAQTHAQLWESAVSGPSPVHPASDAASNSDYQDHKGEFSA